MLHYVIAFLLETELGVSDWRILVSRNVDDAQMELPTYPVEYSWALTRNDSLDYRFLTKEQELNVEGNCGAAVCVMAEQAFPTHLHQQIKYQKTLFSLILFPAPQEASDNRTNKIPPHGLNDGLQSGKRKAKGVIWRTRGAFLA